MPNSRNAAAISDVATGRRMKGLEIFTTAAASPAGRPAPARRRTG